MTITIPQIHILLWSWLYILSSHSVLLQHESLLCVYRTNWSKVQVTKGFKWILFSPLTIIFICEFSAGCSCWTEFSIQLEWRLHLASVQWILALAFSSYDKVSEGCVLQRGVYTAHGFEGFSHIVCSHIVTRIVVRQNKLISTCRAELFIS